MLILSIGDDLSIRALVNSTALYNAADILNPSYTPPSIKHSFIQSV
jgi:hypothetical protein